MTCCHVLPSWKYRVKYCILLNGDLNSECVLLLFVLCIVMCVCVCVCPEACLYYCLIASECSPFKWSINVHLNMIIFRVDLQIPEKTTINSWQHNFYQKWTTFKRVSNKCSLILAHVYHFQVCGVLLKMTKLWK